MALKDALGARRCVAVDAPRQVSWSKDFFLAYPPVERLEEHHAQTHPAHRGERELRPHTPLLLDPLAEYRRLLQYYRGNKGTQRQLLADAGIPTPASQLRRGTLETGGRYVVRPLRHFGGSDYRITDDPDDFVEGQEYISRLYPKRHEYRIIFVLGQALITLYKRVPLGIDPDGPWNHASGSSFVTVTQEENNRLRRTDCVERLSQLDVVKSAHLVAADIMLGRREDGYAVCELNFCPSLTIASNLERIRTHVHQVRG